MGNGPRQILLTPRKQLLRLNHLSNESCPGSKSSNTSRSNAALSVLPKMYFTGTQDLPSTSTVYLISSLNSVLIMYADVLSPVGAVTQFKSPGCELKDK